MGAGGDSLAGKKEQKHSESCVRGKNWSERRESKKRGSE